MAVKMRRNFSGEFEAHFAADATWRIARNTPQPLEIIVGGADSQREAAAAARLEDVRIEWHGPDAQVTFESADRLATIGAKSVIVHEPLPALYASLPLAAFDARAQRFWRRVFFLVRIPGGRRLLKILAHASRNKA